MGIRKISAWLSSAVIWGINVLGGQVTDVKMTQRHPFPIQQGSVFILYMQQSPHSFSDNKSRKTLAYIYDSTSSRM